MSEIRLQKFMAEHGIASRRKAEAMILEGRVSVNGEVIHATSAKIARQPNQIAWWAHLDVSEYMGKTAEINAAAPQLITSADQLKNVVPLYKEKGRPQIHFSQTRRIRWIVELESV